MPLVNKEISPGWFKLKVHKCWGGGGGVGGGAERRKRDRNHSVRWEPKGRD